ncbi:hypothetical protein J6E39_06395 [bacterium]|nr:hypothetical protein [bacterium]
MKKYVFLFVISAIFVIFTVFNVRQKEFYDVLTIKEPDVIGVDLNHNGIQDENEFVCVSDVKTYRYNINDTNSIKMWYLADGFAHKILESKRVKVKLSNERTPLCTYGSIEVENQNYKDILTKANFNLNDYDKNKAKEQLKVADKLNLVIYNHKSGIYHKLTCKYGQVAHDVKILPESYLDKSARPCKFCHVVQEKKKYTHKKFKILNTTFPLSMTDGNLKLILSDFTRKLKPDNRCDSIMCKTVLDEINASKSSIDMAVYDFSNNEIILSALKRALARGVKIRVVYDITAKGLSEYSKDTSFLIELIGSENCRSDKLSDNVQTAFLMHNKFMIFDGKTVFTGSMNFSTTGISGFNNNSVLLIKSPDIAKLYESEFNLMFSGKFHKLKNHQTQNKNDKLRVYFSPQDKTIISQIIPLINSAKTYIYIPTFILTHEELTQSLIAAYRRGVDVRIIVDATSIRSSRSKIKLLRENFIPVKTENYAGKMHSKSVIIDDKYLVIGSMNFSKSGENKNDENCVIIENPKLAKFYREYFEYIWTKIPDKYLKINPSAEGPYSIGSCADGVDNDFDGKIDLEDEGCRPKAAK